MAVARYLIERGANKEAATSDGATSLHFAAFDGHTEVVRMLVEHGANKDALDRWGA